MQPHAYSIIAATCYGNRGAEAMLETVVGRLSEARPGARFHVFTYYPEDDRRLIEDARVSLHSSTPLALVAWLLPWALAFGLLRLLFGRRILRFGPRAIRGLGESVALADVAGVSFIDGREKFLPFNLLTLLPAWLLGTPIVKLSQAMGPFKGPVNRALAGFMLPRCAMVWARGARTNEHLRTSGLDGVRYLQADDIAFNHRDGYSLSREAPPELDTLLDGISAYRQSGGRGVIGLCPSSVVSVKSRKEGGNYESVLESLVDEFSGRGFLVVLFPNATRATSGDAERNNDLPLIRRVLRAVTISEGAPMPLACDADVNASSIKRIIAATDVVIVSRFHAMVGALSLEVPSVVLGWSHKYAEVMARFGLEQHVLDYKAITIDDLRERVETVFEQRGAIRAVIAERLPEVKASAAKPIDGLLQPPSFGGGIA